MKVKLHSQIHEWRENDEYGEMHIYRAEWDSRKWTFFQTTKKDPEWNDFPNPGIAIYESLRDVLWRKYQRKRLSFKFVEDMDELLVRLRAEAGIPEPKDDDDLD